MKDGYVVKSKSESKVSETDLELINKLTRRKFEAEEVYTFNVVLCDNDIDRDFERFTDESLEKLSKMFVGKTGIIDHNASSENQMARIFDCTVEILPKKLNRVKQTYKRLVARAYMPRSEKNKDLILEIDSGIKKEVSVGCSVENRICSICGKNLNNDKCAHKKGRRYKKGNSFEICHVILDNPLDAYEWSFVAVPAQPEAGVIKAFLPLPKGGEKNMEEIIKSLDVGKDVNLSAAECEKLSKMIVNLKQEAELGKAYRENLKRDVLKLSAMVQPEISSDLMQSIVEKLSADELESFKKCFKSKLAKIIPPSPQFSAEAQPKSVPENIQFKI